jgi:hypothetical protein
MCGGFGLFIHAKLFEFLIKIRKLYLPPLREPLFENDPGFHAEKFYLLVLIHMSENKNGNILI